MISFFPLILVIVEWVAIVIVGVRFVVKINRLGSSTEVKQIELQKVGRVLGWVGSIAALGLPRIFDVRYRYDTQSLIAAAILYTIGFAIMFIGFQLHIDAYKPPEDTSDFTARLGKGLFAYWQSFWRDNSE
jgi:hypothetical protein